MQHRVSWTNCTDSYELASLSVGFERERERVAMGRFLNLENEGTRFTRLITQCYRISTTFDWGSIGLSPEVLATIILTAIFIKHKIVRKLSSSHTRLWDSYLHQTQNCEIAVETFPKLKFVYESLMDLDHWTQELLCLGRYACLTRKKRKNGKPEFLLMSSHLDFRNC